MSTKLTVICYILLCLWAGVVLTLLPWVPLGVLLPWLPLGIGEWGDNYILLYVAQTTRLQGLQAAVASGWVRGAVTGLGLLNIGMAFWEIAHFRRTVNKLDEAMRHEVKPAAVAIDESQPTTSANIPNHERSAHP